MQKTLVQVDQVVPVGLADLGCRLDQARLLAQAAPQDLVSRTPLFHLDPLLNLLALEDLDHPFDPKTR